MSSGGGFLATWVQRGLVGIAHAVSAAFVSAVLLVLLEARPETADNVVAIVVFAVWVVFIASWLLVPVGALLGVALPRIVRGRSRRTSAMIGLGLGVLVGLVVTALLRLQIDYLPTLRASAIVDDRAWWAEFWKQTGLLGIKLSIFAALWTAGAAISMRGGTDP